MAELKTVYKWMWVWDFEKEEEWLNEMAMQGWALVSVGFAKYTFERCEPGEYAIRLEMHGADPSYISFMEDAGAEYIGRLFAWIYLRRRSEFGPFDLFSDIDSRISHLDRIGRMLRLIGGANLMIGLANSIGNPAARMGWLNLICATLLFYGLGRIDGKKEQLLRERRIRE